MTWFAAPGNPSSIEEIVARLLLAVVLGGVVGWQREWTGKEAGLRTHMLVALGAAMFTLAALIVTADPGERTAADTTRVVQGIAAGIGFLGAGQLLQSRGEVRGITTAAGIWVVGSVGAACGIGHYALATAGTLLVFFVLHVVGWLEQVAVRRRSGKARAAQADPEITQPQRTGVGGGTAAGA